MARRTGRRVAECAVLLGWLLGLAGGARAEIRYVYDAAGRLVAVVDHSGEAAAYRYDAVGNLLGIDRLSAATPAVLAFTPAEGPPGTAVAIDGIGFGAAVGANQVTVGGVAAPIATASATRLVIHVPTGAATGPIAVAAPGGVAESRAPFVVTESRAPRITGFTPAMAAVGAPVVIAGEHLDAPSGPVVTFNGRYAVVGAVTPTSIATAVPEGAGSGRIAASTPWGRAVSDRDFVVLPSPLTAGEVASVARLANPGSVQVALTAPGTVAIVLFDAGMGERLAVRLDQVTIGQSAVTVHGPDGRVLASAPAVGPAGGALRFVAPATGTCAIVVDPAEAATGAMALHLGVADLTVAGVIAPVTMATQERVTVSWTVRNEGTLDIQGGGWFDLVYVTPPGACCGGATPVASVLRPTAALPPGESYSLSGTFAVPLLPAGTYDVTVLADPDNRAWDRDQANNQRAVAVTVTTPDLRPTQLEAPAGAATQQTLGVSWTVKNRGTGPAPGSGWTDALYLSPAPACCEDAVLLASVRRLAAVAPGASYTASASVTVPSVPEGQRYLVLLTDRDGEVYESHEGNNDRAAAITIGVPDLTPIDFSTPATVWARGSAWLSWTVKNAGSGPAVRAWSDRVYLSASATCCAGAKTLLTVAPTPGTAPGTTYTQLLKKVTIPDLPAGSYHLFIRTDDQNSLWEGNESNNQMGVPVTLRRLAQ